MLGTGSVRCRGILSCGSTAGCVPCSWLTTPTRGLISACFTFDGGWTYRYIQYIFGGSSTIVCKAFLSVFGTNRREFHKHYTVSPLCVRRFSSSWRKKAYESLGGLQAVTDHPMMWVGLGLLKEKEACESGVTPAKRKKLLSQVRILEASFCFSCSTTTAVLP